MMNYFLKLKKTLNKGYTLLFAMVISTLVLSVGLTILTISKKESLLASSAQESVYAIYAADSGIECAVYTNTNHYSTLATSTYGGVFPTAGIVIPCSGATTAIVNQDGDDYIFDFDYNINGTACASVRVIKRYVEDPGIGWREAMSIESRGYNIGWNQSAKACNALSPRKVERALLYSS